MKKLWLLGAALPLGVLAAYFFWALAHADADPLDRALTLSPTPALIRRDVAAQFPTRAAQTDAARRDLFAELFTRRFRTHDPKMAIRARFMPQTTQPPLIKLMCPARMEPWNMDRVALSVWREAQECLGECCDVDIYETFIGATPRKVGELRPTKDKTAIARISYRPASAPNFYSLRKTPAPSASMEQQKAQPHPLPFAARDPRMSH